VATAPAPGPGAPGRPDAHGRLDARKALAVFAAFALIQAVVAIAVWLALVVSLALAGGDLAVDTHLRQSFERLAGPMGLAGAVLAGLALVYATLLRGGGPLWIDWRREEGLSPGTPGRSAAGLLLGLLAGAGYVLLAGWLSPLPVDHEPGPLTTMAREGGRLRLVWAAAALLYAPLFEEFLFRGVLYGGLARSWGALAAAVVTSVVFVGLHYLEFAGYWPAAAGVASLALLTLALRITTRSLGPPVAGHLGYNLSMVLLAWAVAP
jgi:membrane protease YdiL (CAAX protease family)